MFPSVIKSVVYTVVSIDIIVWSTLLLGFLIGFIYFYHLRKSGTLVSEEELLKQLIKHYNPEPLVDHNETDNFRSNLIRDKISTKITINNKECINFGCDNFLNLVKNKKITEEAIATIRKYGVGSCGPRGFYGTVDVHLDLENRIAKFMNMEEAVVYSYWFSTVASAIPAYCKRNDVIFCDEMMSFAAQKGMDAAKCKVVYFKHNDVQDLEMKIKEFNKRTFRKKTAARKFLVLEGIYANTGNICNLPPIVALRSKYKMRLFLDESLSLGVLGPTGRGITEHFNIDHTEIDMIIGSLEGIVGSVGGFCVGTHFIIEHQRLSGLGYCFSASLPPVLTRAAYCAFDYLDENCPEICAKLRLKCAQFHTKLQSVPNMQSFGHGWSPIKYLCFIGVPGELCNLYEIYDTFVVYCQEHGVALNAVKNSSTEQWQIKLSINIDFTDEDIDRSIDVMKNASEASIEEMRRISTSIS